MSAWSDFRYIKKARKEHGCICCNQRILAGTGYSRFVGHWDGDFQNWCLCDFCNDYYNYFRLDWSEGITSLSDELREDTLYEYKCPSCSLEKVHYVYSTAKDIITFDCPACDYKETMSLRKACGMEAEI